MLIISTWRWGSKYGQEYLDRLVRGVGRHLSEPHRFLVLTPSEEDHHLTEIPGCFARLRTFDPEWQQSIGMEPGDRIVCIDLDVVITSGLDAVFDRPEPFVILQGANTSNPCKMNGSLWMVSAGYRPDVWTDFSLDNARAAPFFEFPDDQGWMDYKIPEAAAWHCGPESGVYAFRKNNWPKDDQLPREANIVCFPGHRDPAQFSHLPWVQQHWR